MRSSIEHFYQGIDGQWCHFNAPSGNGGPGVFVFPNPLGGANLDFSRLTHPDSPTSRYLRPDTIKKATSPDFHTFAKAPSFSTKEGTIEAIKAACNNQGITLKSQIAYVLATADHETNHTFKPVTEAYWLKNPDAYLKKHHADYYPYYGRGYVQLTWKYNYERYGKMLKEDLVGHPELALKPEIALFILVDGFKNGVFTGKKISDYINAKHTDFVRARRCINGKDKAEQIAALAKNYLAKMS
jgi:predicted chitinase